VLPAIRQLLHTNIHSCQLHFTSLDAALLASAGACCRARVIAAADIDPDNASILVCGGGGVALHVTKKLKDMGSWVWMMQVGRKPCAAGLLHSLIVGHRPVGDAADACYRVLCSLSSISWQ
jgi:hypothetical protein